MIDATPHISSGIAPVTIAGEAFALLPDRAALHLASATLLVADIHLGKTTTFARQGIPLNTALTSQIIQRDLARLTALAQRHKAKHIAIVGDLFHARIGCDDLTMSLLHTWRHALIDPQGTLIPVLLVRGNHDRASGDPPADLAITCVSNDHLLSGLYLRHEPLTPPQLASLTTSPPRPIIAGHLHPVITLASTGRQRARCDCFWMQADRQLILPAFGTFTGGHLAQPAPDDRLLAILPEGDGHVIDVTPLVRKTGPRPAAPRRK